MNENLNIKANIDTGQFDSSLKGMKRELKELEKVDFSILPDNEAKRVLNRMGDLKSSIGDIETELKQADPGNFFNSFSTLAGPAIAGISGLSVGMSAFGMESEKVNEIQQKLMATIAVLSSLQSISDANKLKALVKQLPLQYQDLRNRITNTLTIKAETSAVVANTTAKEVGANTIKKLTILQRLWNASVSANPIMLIVAGILALGAVVYGLSKAFSDNTDKVKESDKAMDGTIIKNETLRKSHNETIRTLRDLDLEYKKITGSISDQQYELEKLNNEYKDIVKTIEKEYKEKAEVAVEESIGFWNGLYDAMLSAGNMSKLVNRKIKRGIEATTEIFNEMRQLLENEDDKHKSRLLNQQENFNRSMVNMIDMLNTEIIDGEREKIENTKNLRLKEIEDSLADENIKQRAIDAVIRNYNKSILKLDQDLLNKQKELRKKSIDDMSSWISGLYNDDMTEQEKEIESLIENAENIKKSLDLAFPSDIDKTSQEYINAVNNINEALESYTTKINEKYKDLYSKELFQFRVENNLLSLKKMEDDEIESIKKVETFNRLSQEEQDKIIRDIKQKYVDKELDIEKQKIQKLRNMGINMNKELFDIELRELISAKNNQLITEEQFLQARNELRKKYDQDYVDESVKMKEVETEMKYMKEQLLFTAIDGLMKLMQQNQLNSHQDEMTRIDNLFSDKLDKLDRELEYGVLTQEEYNQRRDELSKKQAEEEKKLKEKQARDQKRFAIYQVGIDTALSVGKTLATFGIPVALPLMALAASMGALQASLIAASPLPKFRTGSKEPFEETGNAFLHQGEMVIRKEVVDFGNNRDIIRKLNESPIGDLSMGGNNGLSYQQMIEYVNLSFEKYNQIPVIVKESEITDIQNLIRTIKVNSQS